MQTSVQALSRLLHCLHAAGWGRQCWLQSKKGNEGKTPTGRASLAHYLPCRKLCSRTHTSIVCRCAHLQLWEPHKAACMEKRQSLPWSPNQHQVAPWKEIQMERLTSTRWMCVLLEGKVATLPQTYEALRLHKVHESFLKAPKTSLLPTSHWNLARLSQGQNIYFMHSIKSCWILTELQGEEKINNRFPIPILLSTFLSPHPPGTTWQPANISDHFNSSPHWSYYHHHPVPEESKHREHRCHQ